MTGIWWIVRRSMADRVEVLIMMGERKKRW